MNKTPTDKHILEELRNGNKDIWSQVVDEYQDRLLHYAQARARQPADAEDLVQETFAAFIRSINQFRAEASMETYLFVILRNELINHYRKKWYRSGCLVQDVFYSHNHENSEDAFEQWPTPDPSITWLVAQKEQDSLQYQALLNALQEMVGNFKKNKNFRYLKICELLFYSNISNKYAAGILQLNERLIAVVKHRALKQLRETVARHYQIPDDKSLISDTLLSEIWESHRLCCPKRSTLGAFLLETLEPEWFDYVDFHLTTLGCHFCRASFKDLQYQQTREKQTAFKNRILESTVGFFSKPA